MTELRSVKKPSAALLAIMTAVCILREVGPKKVKREGSYTEYDYDWWSSALKVLGNPSLQDTLLRTDPEQLPQQIMDQIEPLIDSEDLSPPNIKKCGKAAQGIYTWL